MTRAELIAYCLTYPGAVEDYPFEDHSSTILRHAANRKWFALIFERDGKLCINLKCEPLEADFFRQIWKSVSPGWHMNKEHWNTVALGGDVPDDELRGMISRSFDLTKPKLKKSRK
ncbi:MAG: MmcQ/YjbR family DNA-binding protein [Oscillospiraceae bacterium]|nr:MmcQ/YjbR family DNA-binding protein [Oscillospiraceae bacterium]